MNDLVGIIRTRTELEEQFGEELAAWAAHLGRSISVVTRECIEGNGLPGRRKVWAREAPVTSA